MGILGAYFKAGSVFCLLKDYVNIMNFKSFYHVGGFYLNKYVKNTNLIVGLISQRDSVLELIGQNALVLHALSPKHTIFNSPIVKRAMQNTVDIRFVNFANKLKIASERDIGSDEIEGIFQNMFHLDSNYIMKVNKLFVKNVVSIQAGDMKTVEDLEETVHNIDSNIDDEDDLSEEDLYISLAHEVNSLIRSIDVTYDLKEKAKEYEISMLVDKKTIIWNNVRRALIKIDPICKNVDVVEAIVESAVKEVISTAKETAIISGEKAKLKVVKVSRNNRKINLGHHVKRKRPDIEKENMEKADMR